MKLIDIIRLLIENKDLILQIIEFLKQLGLFGGDGTIRIQGDVTTLGLGNADAIAAQATQAGLGDNAVAIIRLLLENWQAVSELIKLIRG